MADSANRLLMIAYHYPPFGGSSGLQRTLSFSRHVAEYGWQPVVLTVDPRAYQEQNADQLEQIPASVPVKRAFGLDTARHLSIAGRYFQTMALPDRWVSWALSAIPLGMWLIRKYRPRVLWSTYPIATAHLIALALHRLSGIPWVADFRDPMIEEDPATGKRWPAQPSIWNVRKWIERRVVRECSRAVFVAPRALRSCSERYPDLSDSRWALIGNGFDETAFAKAEKLAAAPDLNPERILLLHSGFLYPGGDRDPSGFFSALVQLRNRGFISASNLHVLLRASGFESQYRKQVAELGLKDIVFFEPSIPYVDALAEMLRADGLLLFQGRDSNSAIPAKYYEYLRARRPILALADSEGDTAHEIRKAKAGLIVPLDQPEQIAAGLLQFLSQIRESNAILPSESEIQSHSRQSKAIALARLFDSVANGDAPVRETIQEDKSNVKKADTPGMHKVIG